MIMIGCTGCTVCIYYYQYWQLAVYINCHSCLGKKMCLIMYRIAAISITVFRQVSLEEESQDISVLEKYVVAPRMFKYVTSKGNETSARVI
jgi:hypothetical protein